MLGLLWAQLRPSWGQLGHTYAIMAPTWHQLGLCWGHLAANLGHHEAMWGPTFAILKPPWASSGHLKSNFEPTSSNLCQLIPTGAILGPFLVADSFDDRGIDTSLLQLPCRPSNTLTHAGTLHPFLIAPLSLAELERHLRFAGRVPS